MALSTVTSEIIRWVVWILLLVFLGVLGRINLINYSPDIYVLLLFGASMVIVVVFRLLGSDNR